MGPSSPYLGVADLDGIHVIYEARKPRSRKLWVVSTQFNPAGYRSLEANYRRFAEHMSMSGVNLVTAELTYPGQYATLSGPGVVQYRARDVMWHKERLLNLVIDQLPAECEAVAWIDADVIFTNEHWVEDTLLALDHDPVVQLFEKVFMLDPQGNHYRDAYGFGFSLRSGFLTGNVQDRYGSYWNGNMKHPGFAWAARRENLAAWGGLYDRHILGGGDFQMALAFVGDQSPDWYGRFGDKFQSHMLDWSTRVHRNTGGSLGFTPGCILHLWHGHSEDRQYIERSKCLVDHDFDPVADLKLGQSGLWEWATQKPELHQKVANYFLLRKDDYRFPVHPTRHEDKFPVIVHVEGAEQLRAALRALAAQRRRDFYALIAFADWQQASKCKHVVRDEYWPFEIRQKAVYGRSQKLVPRRYQAVKGIGPDNHAKRVMFADSAIAVDQNFVTRCTTAPGKVVLDEAGRILAACRYLVSGPSVQAENPSEGLDRLIRVAEEQRLEITRLSAAGP